MARPLRIEFANAFYHVFSRGNERRDVFREKRDYELFLETLKESSRFFDVLVHSFCLMSNHFHLLVETTKPNLSKFMQRLLGVYTTRFNRRHERHGHLFQGRFKALLVEKDSYLLELARYIHLNPVRAKLAQRPEDYPWSSMKNFLNSGDEDFPHTALILRSFGSRKTFRDFVLEGLERMIDPFQNVVGGLFLGSEEFVERFREKIDEVKNGNSEIIVLG